LAHNQGLFFNLRAVEPSMNKATIGVLGVLLAVAAALGGYWFGQQRTGGNAGAGVVAGGASGNVKGAGGKGSPGGGDAKPVVVEAVRVETVSLPQTITAVGSLRSDESIMVRPEVAGRIASIQFQEGQRVNRGSTLVKLDPAVNQAELQQARANLELSRAKHARSIELQQRGFISAQARDEAENNLKVAQAAVALAEARLAKTEIKAPFSGLIGLRSVSIGDYVKEGQDLVNLESIDPLKVDFRVPEVFLRDVKTGQPLEVALDALPDRNFEGRVYAVNPQVDAAGRSFVIRAIVRNPDTALRPGMFARVRLITRDVQQAMVVPEQALVPQGTDHFVYRIVDGKAVRTRVDLGQRRDGRAEIVSGLAASDTVVTAGQVKIRDGVDVVVAGPGAGTPASAGAAPKPRAQSVEKGARPSATKASDVDARLETVSRSAVARS
jgi:membrane fusion protein (multidrug efflux system)